MMIKKIKKNNNFGFSLIEITIAIALASALSVFVMKIMDNASFVSNTSESKFDKSLLYHEMSLLLNNSGNCYVSLALDNNGDQITFKKTDIDEEGEGIPVKLYLSKSQMVQRQRIKFSSGIHNKFGKVKILAINLRAPNGTGYDYSLAIIHEDMLELEVDISYRLSKNKTKKETLTLDIPTKLSTDVSGNSIIIACGRNLHGPVPLPTPCSNLVELWETDGKVGACGYTEIKTFCHGGNPQDAHCYQRMEKKGECLLGETCPVWVTTGVSDCHFTGIGPAFTGCP